MRNSGTLELWNSGILEFWNSGRVVIITKKIVPLKWTILFCFKVCEKIVNCKLSETESYADIDRQNIFQTTFLVEEICQACSSEDDEISKTQYCQGVNTKWIIC